MRFTRILLLASLLALAVVPAALAIAFNDEDFSLPVAETGKAYSFQLTGRGGCGPALPYQYRLLNGAPPPGITMDTSGLLHGTPTATGTYSFWVELSDQNPPSASWCRPSSAQRELSIRVLQGLQIKERQPNLPAGQVGVPYTGVQLHADGGTPTWSVSSGKLPDGLSLNTSTGALSGTPTATGDFTFKITATDGSRSDTQTYVLSIVQPLKIANAAAPASEVGEPFSLTLAATGGKGGYTWALTNGAALPAGLSLDAAKGTITGEPTVAGVSNVKLQVTDALGLVTTADVKIAVAPQLAFTNGKLRTARSGHAYRARLPFVGGVAPRTFTLVRGSVPGLHLDGQTGRLSGVARKAGTYRIVVRVSDALKVTDTHTFVVKVLG